jgi:hypothetical protein
MLKINFLSVALVGGICISMYSCREEVHILEQTESKAVIADATVKNGRLYFPNKEALQFTYKELKNASEDEIIKYVDKNNFHSLRPIITEANENQVINELILRKNELSKKVAGKLVNGGATDDDIIDDLDDMEEIIGDDAYAAMLNGEAEVQIGNEIYKYTDVGLFRTPADKYQKLENFLEVRNISPNLLEPTEVSAKEQFLSDKTEGELLPVAEDVDYFVVNRYPDQEEGGGNGGGGDNGGYNPPTEPNLTTIINGLKVGNVRKPWLGNMFGTTWTTDDKYEDRRRVKVKFYSQNLWLVYAVGCKVKHQYKGWTGLWRKENADVLGIGINSISWTFSHSINYPQGIPKEVYWLDGKMYKSANNTDYINMGNAPMPNIPFSGNNEVDAVIQFSSDLSGLTQQQLDKLFWDFAWKQSNKFLEGQNKKLNRVAFIVDSYQSTYVQYYDFSQLQDNQDEIERVFDWGIATPQFTYTFGGGVGNGTTITSYNFNFLQPTATSVNMYGLAKKNGGWHGVKMLAQ